jgi:hypothetical protein
MPPGDGLKSHLLIYPFTHPLFLFAHSLLIRHSGFVIRHFNTGFFQLSNLKFQIPLPLSHFLTFLRSPLIYNLEFIISYIPSPTFSPSHLLTFSPSHLLTFSPSHLLTFLLSPSPSGAKEILPVTPKTSIAAL